MLKNFYLCALLKTCNEINNPFFTLFQASQRVKIFLKQGIIKYCKKASEHKKNLWKIIKFAVSVLKSRSKNQN